MLSSLPLSSLSLDVRPVSTRHPFWVSRQILGPLRVCYFCSRKTGDTAASKHTAHTPPSLLPSRPAPVLTSNGRFERYTLSCCHIIRCHTGLDASSSNLDYGLRAERTNNNIVVSFMNLDVVGDKSERRGTLHATETRQGCARCVGLILSSFGGGRVGRGGARDTTTCLFAAWRGSGTSMSRLAQ